MKKIVLFITLFISQVSHVWAEGPCDEKEQIFFHTYTVTPISNSQIKLRKKGGGNAAIVVSLGEYIDGILHKHGNTRYRLVSITEDEIEIEYVSNYDATSFGGSNEECKGRMFVKK